METAKKRRVMKQICTISMSAALALATLAPVPAMAIGNIRDTTLDWVNVTPHLGDKTYITSGRAKQDDTSMYMSCRTMHPTTMTVEGVNHWGIGGSWSRSSYSPTYKPGWYDLYIEQRVYEDGGRSGSLLCIERGLLQGLPEGVWSPDSI